MSIIGARKDNFSSPSVSTIFSEISEVARLSFQFSQSLQGASRESMGSGNKTVGRTIT